LGPNLIGIARQRLPDVRFVVAAFEDVELAPETFDLVASATAFHWVDPRIAYRKAARLLRGDGRLALLSHRVVAGPLANEFEAVVKRCAPSFPLMPRFTAADLRTRVQEADRDDISSLLAAIEGNPTRAVSADRWFTRPQLHTVEWDEHLDADHILAALVATSVWVDIASPERDRLDAGLRELALRAGGSIPRRRVTTLLMSHRL
jgi:SAM-dependent methyltransferase